VVFLALVAKVLVDDGDKVFACYISDTIKVRMLPMRFIWWRSDTYEAE
jgi:hypothetical protein